jgi:hypothetical protein
MALKGSNDTEKLKDLFSKTYKEQAVWFLNGYWKQQEKEAENIWKYAQKMVELDKDKGKEGNQLDEFQAHRFLESFKDPLTVLEMREKLFKVGIEKTKFVSLSAYLLSHYTADWHYLVNAPQGDNQEEVLKAQQLLDSVQKAFVDVQNTAQASVARESEARTAEAASKEAKLEVQKLEAAYHEKTAQLTKKTEEGGVVSQNKAKAELAQHLAEDPLPLRRAKISAEAAHKKAENAVAAAIAARAAAEKALEDAQLRVAEAQKYLDEVSSRPGSAAGALWWINRELHEARAYMPTSKGGYAKKNVQDTV